MTTRPNGHYSILYSKRGNYYLGLNCRVAWKVKKSLSFYDFIIACLKEFLQTGQQKLDETT